jgi:ubiquinone biosynthesis protein
MIGQDISDEIDDEETKRGLSKVLSHKYQDFKRAAQIMAALSKYGFGKLGPSKKKIKEMGLDPEAPEEIKDLTEAVRFRLMLQSLGPTFVKLGQMLSTRPDLIDEEFALELENLREKVPPEPPEVVMATIQSELGRPADEIFDELPDAPIAAASIGQVYKAKIKGTDQWVAVKVQRSNIFKTIRADISVLKDMSKFMSKAFSSIENLNMEGAVEEFGIMIMRELDYTLEARNIRRLSENMAEIEGVRVPELYMNLSSSRVLTMEFIDGIALDKLDTEGAPDVDPTTLVSPLVGAVLKQIFIDGFFHADPHHGNLFVDRNGMVVFIDLGAMGYLESHLKGEVTEFYMALMKGDEEKAAYSIVEICGHSLGDINISRLAHDIRDFMDYLEMKREGYEIDGGINQSAVTILLKNGLHPPTSWVLLERAMMQLEGVVVTLNPATDYLEVAKESISLIAKDKMAPRTKEQPLQALLTARAYVEFLRDLPTRADRLMTKLETDNLVVKVDVPFLEDFQRTVRRAGLMVSISLMALAMIMGSVNAGEFYIGPILGIQFTVTFVLVVWLISMWLINKWM